MVGRLEVLQDETTCHAQLAFCVCIERLAADERGEMGKIIFRVVSPVRLRLFKRLGLRGRRLWRLVLGSVRLAGNLLRKVLGYQGSVQQ